MDLASSFPLSVSVIPNRAADQNRKENLPSASGYTSSRVGLRCTGARTIQDVTDEETRGRQGYHVRSTGKSWATRCNYLLSKLEGAAGDSLLVRRAILLSYDLGRPVLWFWHQRKRPRVIPLP